MRLRRGAGACFDGLVGGAGDGVLQGLPECLEGVVLRSSGRRARAGFIIRSVGRALRKGVARVCRHLSPGNETICYRISLKRYVSREDE